MNTQDGTTKHHTKKHGVLDRLFGKKPGSSHRLSPEPMTQQSGSSKVKHFCISFEIANIPEISRIGWKILHHKLFLSPTQELKLKKTPNICSR